MPTHSPVLGRPRRADIEATIARLLDLLDAADGDTDLEPDCDLEGDDAEAEPLLGASEAQDSQAYWGDSARSDAEFDDADDEPGAEAEPWLGAPENAGDQTGWACGNDHDHEATFTIDDFRAWRGHRTRGEAETLRTLECRAVFLARRLRRRHARLRKKHRDDIITVCGPAGRVMRS